MIAFQNNRLQLPTCPPLYIAEWQAAWQLHPSEQGLPFGGVGFTPRYVA